MVLSVHSTLTMPSPKHQKRIAVVSSSRADLAHLIHPLRALQAERRIELSVLATGALLQPEFGNAVDRLVEEGLHVVKVPCPLNIESGADAARAIGAATTAFADALETLSPEILVVVADRFEMLAPANAALAMRIPIAHIEGGERSEGAIDDAIRNALTKMSHVHLVATEEARQRVLAMGEEDWRVHRVGAASLDHVQKSVIPERPALEMELGIALGGPLLLVGVHPVTLEDDPTFDARAVLNALANRKERIVFCFPNADEGSREISELVGAFAAKRQAAYVFRNLPPETWFGLLYLADAIIGNSSSVLMESPTVPLPAVCVGKRQAGRERASNVIDAPANPVGINEAIDQALAMELGLVTNPFGDGRASERIVRALADLPDTHRLLHKQTTIRLSTKKMDTDLKSRRPL